MLLTPEKLTGGGAVKYSDAKLSAGLLNFKSDVFNTEKANFQINSLTSDKLALNTKEVEARVSFIEKKSKFKSLQGTGLIELPENRYHAYVEKFEWDMDDKNVELQTPNKVQVFEAGRNRIVDRQDAGLAPKGSMFVSMHHEQDSLRFSSPVADFDLKTNTLYAHEVKYIRTADAFVYPHEGEVTVEEKARMRTLQNAEVLANIDTRYHTFHKATININSRKKYHGEGKYNYEDELGRFQEINFDMIGVDSLQNTYARGKIKGIEDFSLSPAFNYQGNVNLYAPEKYLSFDGYTQINHECSIEESWVKFESDIDPKNIFIPLQDQDKDINDKFLISGAAMATDSIHVFPTFVSPRKLYSNEFVSTAGEFLHYDNRNKRYEIGSKQKITNQEEYGNYLSLHKNYCNLYSEGDLDLCVNLGQVKIETKGNSNYEVEKDELKLESFMTLDFWLPQGALKIIGDTLKTMTAMPAADLKKRTYTRGVVEILGKKEGDKMLKEQTVFGSLKKVPNPFLKSFVFSEVNLKWNSVNRTWESVGPFSIAMLDGVQVNKVVKGHLEIDRKRSGDSFTFYLEITPTHWYFFTYKRGLMQVYSSEDRFNQVIAAVKGKDRKMDVERGEASYVFMISNLKKRNQFLERIRNEGGENEENKYEEYDNFD